MLSFSRTRRIRCTALLSALLLVLTGTLRAADPGTYLVVDLSGGADAASYPVTYLNAVPAGGWTDVYKTTKLVLRRIPAGTFTMGAPAGELGTVSDTPSVDYEFQHPVKLTLDAYVGVFEVTQRQWELVMGTKPSYFNNATYYATRPVEQTTWNDIRGDTTWPTQLHVVSSNSFFGRLRARTGILGFDLPTESQWEYACRAGTTTALNSGVNLTSTTNCPNANAVGRNLYNAGNVASPARGVNLSQGTAKVGSYLPNSWGLYDMHGNVGEWALGSGSSVWYYGNPPKSTLQTDPEGGQDSMTEPKPQRGGSWAAGALWLRSARSDSSALSQKTLGLRVFCAPPNQHLVKYGANGATGGSVPGLQAKTAGTALTLHANTGNLVRTGYSLAGWNTKPGGDGIDYPLGGAYTVNNAVAAVRLYAKWFAATYNVTYNSNGATGGAVPGSQVKVNGRALTLAANSGNLVRAGYTFAGWNTVTNGSGTNYSEGQRYTADANLTLHAKWTTANTFTVTYNTNGATGGSAPAPQVKTQGVNLVLATNYGGLVKDGSTFGGWNTAANGSGTAYAANANYTANAPVVLYATWNPPVTYTVSFNGVGSTGGSAPAPRTKTAGIPLVMPGGGSLARTGSRFANWTYFSNATGTITLTEGDVYTLDQSITLTPEWVPSSYTAWTITYATGQAASGTAPVRQRAVQYSFLKPVPNYGNLSKPTYAFKGWNTRADGTGTDFAVDAVLFQSTPAVAANLVANNLTLYPKFHRPTYTVRFHPNLAESGTVPVNQTKTYGVALTLSGNSGGLTKAGFTFAGWSTMPDGSGTNYVARATYTQESDNILYARWLPGTLPTYPVTYNANGATAGSAPAAQVKTEGVALTLASNGGGLAKTGHTFAGWNTSADGSGTAFSGASMFSIDAPTVLYASWLPVTLSTYAITYDVNGATGGTAPAAQKKVQGLALSLSANSGNLVRSGFVFAGWNTAPDGSGTNYAPGAKYTVEGEATMYAAWTREVAGGFVSGQPLSFKVMSSTVVRRTGKVRKSELRVPAGMPRYRKGQAVTFRVGSAGQLVSGKLSLPLRKATATKNYHLFKKTGRRGMTGKAVVAKSPAASGALASAKGLRLTFVRRMGSSTVTVTYVLTKK